jgi:hypothetical protein
MAHSAEKLKRRLLTVWPKGRTIIQMIGKDPATELFDIVLANGYVRPQYANQRQTEQQILTNVVDLYLDLEIINFNKATRVNNGLTTGFKGQHANTIANNIMAENTYGVQPNDSDLTKAAKWVCNASNTTRGNAAEIAITASIIQMSINARTPITFMVRLDAINRSLMAGGGRNEARGPVALPMSSPLPSSMGGRVLLEAAVSFLASRTHGAANCLWTDLGCYLLGATIGCHGFPDANGRTGRVLYAICQVQSGAAFQGLTTVGEEALHGLPHQ